MFLKDFLKYFSGSPDTFWVNAHTVEKLGRSFTIRTAEEVDETSEKLASLKQDLEGEIQRRKELQKEIAELENILSKFNGDGVTVKEVVEENNQLKEQIRTWRKNALDLTAKIEKLKARKNKATLERDYKTGHFVAEFQGVKYNLVKQQ